MGEEEVTLSYGIPGSVPNGAANSLRDLSQVTLSCCCLSFLHCAYEKLQQCQPAREGIARLKRSMAITHSRPRVQDTVEVQSYD